MIAAVLVCVLLNFVTIGYGFFSSIIANKHVCERRTVSIGRENGLMLHAAAEEDPNFEAHLPSMLKAGLAERPSPEVASELRSRYKAIASTKRRAAEVLKSSNVELAVELEELADELEDTQSKFVQAALCWDAWNRPSPDLPTQLRAKVEPVDPNFQAHLKEFVKKGKANDEDFELPSALRLLKMKSTAAVKRLAAKELKATTLNPALAEELEEMADEIEESHRRFEIMATNFAAMKAESGFMEEEG